MGENISLSYVKHFTVFENTQLFQSFCLHGAVLVMYSAVYVCFHGYSLFRQL
jgi:hypothetical protein